MKTARGQANPWLRDARVSGDTPDPPLQGTAQAQISICLFNRLIKTLRGWQASVRRGRR
jgi:hypothetical protein